MELMPNMNEIFKWNRKRGRERSTCTTHMQSIQRSKLNCLMSTFHLFMSNSETHLKCMPLQTIDMDDSNMSGREKEHLQLLFKVLLRS